MIRTYPEIDYRISPIIDDGYRQFKSIIIETKIRKKNDEGKYYFVHVKKTGEFDLTTHKTDEDFNKWIEYITKLFTIETYFVLISHRYSDKIIEPIYGKPLFELDTNQIDEGERILKFLNLR